MHCYECLCVVVPCLGKCVALCGGPVNVCVGCVCSYLCACVFNCATNMIALHVFLCDQSKLKVKVKEESILLKEKPINIP